ncbi:hypothetical protein [Flavobacterium sp.]|uniref:hypothetical protein n=1 Tax=Flavobacterium sp. TaxID=239 RepID=UPI0037532307
MKNKIKYVGFYDEQNSKKKRVSSLAATNKMDYIYDSLQEIGCEVCIVSPSWFNDSCVLDSKLINEENQLKKKNVKFVPSSFTSNKLTRVLKIAFSLLWLISYLVFFVKKGEKIIVYHSPWLAFPVLLAKRIKKFYLILEVEEIYHDVSSISKIFTFFEKKIIDKADAFLFSTDLLQEKVNHIKDKPNIIIYGNYKVYETLNVPSNDGKVHLVYAGIIDSHKAGVFNALESCKFLPSNYILNIVGFGEVEKLQKQILEVNSDSACKAYFYGEKKGEEYIKFCQACHIGLSTQNIDGEYVNSSFPSKILSYLGMGLKVVSCKIDCVSNSKIGELVVYYNKNKPKEIAEAILNVSFDKSIDIKSQIRKLDTDFKEQLKSLLY